MTTPNNTVAGLVEKVREIITLLRQPEPDNGEKYTEFDEGYDQASSEIADMLEAALASPAPSAKASPNPLARYWMGRAEFWMHKAIALGWREVRDAANGEAPSAPPSVAGDTGELPELPKITRYDVVGDIAYPIHEAEFGSLVDYDDHAAAMRAYGEQCRRLATAEQPGVDLCEVARELERVHAAHVIAQVSAIAEDRTDAYWSGYSMACDEIAHRLNLTPAEQPGSAVQGEK